MADSLSKRIKHAWNAFLGNEEYQSSPTIAPIVSSNYSYNGARVDRIRLRYTSERSIISSIYTRISIDVADVEFKHVRLDGDGRYTESIDSKLARCLDIEANIDQDPRAFRQDIVMSLFDKGVIAIVPVDLTLNPSETTSWDILSLRVGEIIEWYPEHVKVNVYNQKIGRREDIILPKSIVAIVENPLYSVMNEPNSTLQRLIRKLNLLDTVDEQSSSGKLDLIIQLPYVIKSEARKTQAETRRKDIEMQLKGSQYGIAYTDGTEKITQLNRPVENNLLAQVTYLTEMLYNQLGLTEDILKGTANEATMLNYYNRTVKPLLDAISEAMTRKFLTKTAITQKQAIVYFRDPFKLVPISQIADIADKFTRNEIATSNEIRSAIGWKPSKDPKADELRNSNMPQPTTGQLVPTGVAPEEDPGLAMVPDRIR